MRDVCEFYGSTVTFVFGSLPACCSLKQTDEEFRGHIRKHVLTWWKR